MIAGNRLYTVLPDADLGIGQLGVYAWGSRNLDTRPPGLERMNDTDTLVWTGREVLALGTACAIGGNVEAPDLAYDPHTAGWRSLPVLSFDDRPRCGSDAFWTGSQVVVWGGGGGNGIVADNRVRVYTPPAAPVVTATTTTTASIAPTDPLDGLALESFAARVVVEEYLAASTPRPPSSS